MPFIRKGGRTIFIKEKKSTAVDKSINVAAASLLTAYTGKAVAGVSKVNQTINLAKAKKFATLARASFKSSDPNAQIVGIINKGHAHQAMRDALKAGATGARALKISRASLNVAYAGIASAVGFAVYDKFKKNKK